MVWFDEGFAEFCTWSTTDSGIRPRKRLVGRIQADGQNRMTVTQILSVGYGDFTFYRYSAMLFGYWYEHDLGTLLELLELVRAGDVPGWDAKIAQLKADPMLQAAYDQHLNDLIANIDALDDPLTVTPLLDALDLATAAGVETHVRQTRIGHHAKCSVAAVDANTRFSARGTLSGRSGNQRDLVAAWRVFDDDLDEMIGELKQQKLNNFTAVNARFGRIRWIDHGDGRSHPIVDYFVEGPLPHSAGALLPPLQQVTADFRSTRLGVPAQADLVRPKAVEVHLSLTTVLHPDATADSVLEQELEDDLVELRNQVYAIRPPYYRNLEVGWKGTTQMVQDANQQKHGVRQVFATVEVP